MHKSHKMEIQFIYYKLKKIKLEKRRHLCEIMANIKKPTPPKSDSAYVYENLRADIILGRIKPYEHIVERNYAAKLGVSRTPVREALRLLERDGLVVFRPKRGATARALVQEKNVEEVFELRSILQLSYAKETIEGIQEKELAEMKRCNENCFVAIASLDAEAFFHHYDRFNAMLIEGCGKEVLIKLLNYLDAFNPSTSVTNGVSSDVPSMRVAMSTWERRRTGLLEHVSIWEALQARDLEAYTDALQRHISNSERACRESLQKLWESRSANKK